MFTGIIEELGAVESVQTRSAGARPAAWRPENDHY